jgi:hypothetical protein
MDAQFTGLWTQRSPLRDADVPYLYRKFYSASRFDSMIDGINREISPRLTDVRRAGSSVYNSSSFPPGYSWYAFKWVRDNQEVLRVIYDGRDGNIYDATANQKLLIAAKSSAAAHARFLGIGSVLYIADGAKTMKWVRSQKSWAGSTAFATGAYIVDSNGNLQLSIGAQTATIVNIQVESLPSPVGTRKVSLYFSPSTPLEIKSNIALTLAGLTTVPSANGTTPYTVADDSGIKMHYTILASGGNPPVTPYSVETGTASTGTGITGSTEPAWNTTQGLVTQDGGNQWVNMGSALQNLGGAAPTDPPLVTTAAAPSIYHHWAASTWYAPSGAFIILDSNGNLQQLTTAGTTGSAAPAWNTTLGGTTAEAGGTAVWTNLGPATWMASTAYAVGAVVLVTFTYTITQGQSVPYPPYFILTTTTVTVTQVFTCTTAGTSGANPPQWTNGLGTTVSDSTVVWTNTGAQNSWPASATLSLDTRVIDTNGNIERPQQLGESGTAAPSWSTGGTGSTTPDGSQMWLNAGPYSPASTGAWQWAYSGKNSITGYISNPSPTSAPLTLAAGQLAVIQGAGLADPQYDTIILWRTAQDGSVLLYDDEFPNPGAGQIWIYTDTNSDQMLNAEIAAPGSTAGSTLATPPPATATCPEYHCGRIWMINGSYVIYSGGPDTVTGNGNESFPPGNYFQLPEQPIRLKSITVSGGGLVVFCVSNTYIILGDGTGTPPFLAPRMYMENVGLANYDALCMVGSTFHGFSNKSKVFSFDPSNGYIEEGFPIGDQFVKVSTGGIGAALYSLAGTYVTWHEKNSTDTGLYVADGAVGWFRWSPIAPPESGSLWSPRAAIQGGTSCVQSVETAPGIFDLLIGPPVNGPMLKRDAAVYGDWTAGAYAPYPSWDVKGAIGLCDTGEVAEIVHIALKSVAAGARPAVSLLLDELAAGVTVEGRTTAWDQLSLDDGHHEDPPNIEPSITMFSDRYKASSSAETPKCETFQLKIDYGPQQVADELLKFAVYGGVFKERKQQ